MLRVPRSSVVITLNSVVLSRAPPPGRAPAPVPRPAAVPRHAAAQMYMQLAAVSCGVCAPPAARAVIAPGRSWCHLTHTPSLWPLHIYTRLWRPRRMTTRYTTYFNPLPWPGNGDHPETRLSRLTPNVGEDHLGFMPGTPPQHASGNFAWFLPWSCTIRVSRDVVGRARSRCHARVCDLADRDLDTWCMRSSRRPLRDHD